MGKISLINVDTETRHIFMVDISTRRMRHRFLSFDNSNSVWAPVAMSTQNPLPSMQQDEQPQQEREMPSMDGDFTVLPDELKIYLLSFLEPPEIASVARLNSR